MTAPVEHTEEPSAPEPQNRRERRAKRKGAPALPIQGPVAGLRYPVPNRQRDYAVRRRG